MTTNVTTPVIYALGTLTTASRFLVIALALVSDPGPAPPPRAPRQRCRKGGLSHAAVAPGCCGSPRPGLRTPRRSPRRSTGARSIPRPSSPSSARPRATAASTISPAATPPGAEAAAGRAPGCPLAEVEKRVAIVMSGGTEGGLSPHLLVFCREEATAAPPAPRLAIGVAPDARLQAGRDRPQRADRGDRRRPSTAP